MNWRSCARFSLALFYAAAGLFHLLLPAPFIKITPEWVPMPALVIALTGIAIDHLKFVSTDEPDLDLVGRVAKATDDFSAATSRKLQNALAAIFAV